MVNEKFPDLSKYKTIAEVIADKIRQQIINGELEPNQKLSQEKLSRVFGVSRMPVRDALYRLGKEGLLIVSKRNGARVCQLGVEDLQEIYSIRVLLESMATKEGVSRLTQTEISKLESAGEKADQAVDNGELDQFLKMDRRFHFIVYEAADKLRLLELISNLWNATEHYRRLYCAEATRLETARSNHRLYLAACVKKDKSRAVELIKQHLLETVNEISRFLRSGSSMSGNM